MNTDFIFSEALHFGVHYSSSCFGLWTTLTVIAVIAIVATAVLGIVSAFTPPKPSRISFGAIGGSDGPRYGSFGALDNTISNEITVPVLYGEVKLAGNVIWQSDPGESVSRIIGLCEGQIQDISDVRANDNVIDDVNTPGSNFTLYYGTVTQQADSRIPASLRQDLEFHNLAYIAITLTVSEKIKGGNPTITSVCQGTLVETWDSATQTWLPAKTYSRNPAACIRDFIINGRYGLGFPKTNLDDDTFGAIYEYCQETVAVSAAFQAGTGTVFLLHMDGNNGSTAFLDSSSNPKAVSVFGNAQISTANFKEGSGSGLFDGSSYLSVAASDDLSLGSRDFTIRVWTRFSAVGIDQTIIDINGSSSGAKGITFFGTTANVWVVQIAGVNCIIHSFTPATGVWYYWEITRNGSSVNLFRDGVKCALTGATTGIDSTEITSSPNGMRIGNGFDSLSGRMFRGNMDGLEIIKGLAAHTAAFDTPDDNEARFRLDYVIDSQRPAQDVLNDMLATFGGYLVYSGSKIKLGCEKQEVITQYFGDGSTTAQNATFDPNNIVRDSMSWNFPSVDDRPNRVKIQWVDPSQNYVKVYTQVDDWIDQNERNIVIVKEVALLGITRASQAARMAKLFMAKAKYATANVQFSARLESIHCEVGDVIAITHQASMWYLKLMRITDMQEAEDETIRFVCTEYNPSIYDDRQGAAVLVQQQPTGPNLYAPLSDVTNMTVREDNFFNSDGTFVVNLLAEWTALPDDEILRLDYYLIQYSDDGGVNYKDAGFASAQKTSFRIVLGNVQTDTNFIVRVKTVSDRGAESAGVTADIQVSGKITAPGDVDDFAVEFSEDHLTFVWSAVDDIDLFGYEIRVGDLNSRWETAAIVATEILGVQYYSFSVTRGTLKYFIKAIDNSGNYSENAVSDVITITDIPQRNIVMNMDLFSRITHPERHPLFGEVPFVDTANDLVRGGNALRFNGANQFIEIPDSSAWRLGGGTGPFAIEAYVNFSDVTGPRTIMSQVQDGNNFWTWVYSVANGGLTFLLVSGGVTLFQATNNWVPVKNTWYHLRFTRLGDLGSFFFNGVVDFQPSFAGVTFPDLSAPLHIGMFGGTGSPMMGMIDEVRISSTERSTSTFVLNYETWTYKSGFAYFPFVNDAYTDLLLHLDETGGPLVKDASSNKRNGMVNNAPDWTTGIVGYWIERIVPYLTNDINPAYNRQTLGPITFYSFLGLENGVYTHQQIQDDDHGGAYPFVFGEERYYGSESIYQTDAIQVSGSSSTATYKLDLQSASTDNLGFFVPYISTSLDGITYSAFTPFVNGQYTAKFVKLQFRMQAMTAISIVRLVSAKLVVDAPDRSIKFQNEAVSAGGRTFNLTGFAQVTSVILTVVGTSPLIPRIQDQSNLPISFDVRLVDTTGAAAAGNVNVRIEGY